MAWDLAADRFNSKLSIHGWLVSYFGREILKICGSVDAILDLFGPIWGSAGTNYSDLSCVQLEWGHGAAEQSLPPQSVMNIIFPGQRAACGEC